MSGSVISSTTVINYANLSSASYKKNFAPLGYKIIGTDNQPNGFSATAFQNVSTGEIVIAYKGTDDLKDLTQADMALALQKVPDQYE